MIDAPGTGRMVRTDAGLNASSRGIVLPEIADGQLVGGALIQRVSRFAIASICAVALIVIGAIAARDTSVVRVTGILEPGTIWFARAQESGTIEEVRVRLGQAVNAGDTLATLDTGQIAEEIRSLRSQVRALELQRLHADAAEQREREARLQRITLAKARVLRAEAEWRDRLSAHGYLPGAGAPKVVEGAHIAVDMAMADVRTAHAELALSQLDTIRSRTIALEHQQQRQQREAIEIRISRLEDRRRSHVIRAPASGIVLAGDTRELSGIAVVAGQPVLQIGDPNEWRVTMQMSDEDVRKIQLGAVARVEPNGTRSISRSTLTATVDFIAPAAVSNGSANGKTYYRVEATLDAPSLQRLETLHLRRGHGVGVGFTTPAGSRLKSLVSALAVR